MTVKISLGFYFVTQQWNWQKETRLSDKSQSHISAIMAEKGFRPNAILRLIYGVFLQVREAKKVTVKVFLPQFLFRVRVEVQYVSEGSGKSFGNEQIPAKYGLWANSSRLRKNPSEAQQIGQPDALAQETQRMPAGATEMRLYEWVAH